MRILSRKPKKEKNRKEQKEKKNIFRQIYDGISP